MKSLPLVNLSLLRPLVAALSDRGFDPETVLDSVGLTEAAVSAENETVHVMVVHQFLEACAAAVDDPTFCAAVAARLDPTGWPMIEAALASSGSLADFLATYVSRANEVATSVSAFLEIRGNEAVFGETRLFRPTILPAQNDGFMVGLAVSILRRLLDDQFNAGQVTLVLCDPTVLPVSYAQFPRLKGDEMGFRIRFPSAWLALPLGLQATAQTPMQSVPTHTVSVLVSDLKKLISHQIGKGGLDAEGVARIAGMSRSSLARRLAKEGTSISREIQLARLAFAKDRLITSDQTVEEIAAALGYANASNFSRAFRDAEGDSPRAFRSKAAVERK